MSQKRINDIKLSPLKTNEQKVLVFVTALMQRGGQASHLFQRVIYIDKTYLEIIWKGKATFHYIAVRKCWHKIKNYFFKNDDKERGLHLHRQWSSLLPKFACCKAKPFFYISVSRSKLNKKFYDRNACH